MDFFLSVHLSIYCFIQTFKNAHYVLHKDKLGVHMGYCLEIAEWHFSTRFVDQVIRKGEVSCCWICTACKNNEFVQDEFTCKACELGWWPDEELEGGLVLFHSCFFAALINFNSRPLRTLLTLHQSWTRANWLCFERTAWYFLGNVLICGLAESENNRSW